MTNMEQKTSFKGQTEIQRGLASKGVWEKSYLTSKMSESEKYQEFRLQQHETR